MALSETTAAPSGPGPTPRPPGSGALFVTSTVLAVIRVRTSVAVANWPGSLTEVAVFCTWYGPPVAEGGSAARRTIVIDAPGRTGPESATKLPFESVSGVTPSAWNSEYDVPGGKVPAPIAMSNTSVALPTFVR